MFRNVGGIVCFVFSLDEQLFALSLQAVEKIVQAVEIKPVPRTSEILLGLLEDSERGS